MAYYVQLNSGVGGGNAALHGVHLGHVPLSPLNIHAVVGARSNSPGHGFEVNDFSFDIEQVLTIGSATSGAGAGKVTFNPFHITKKIDGASPVFFKTLVPGKSFSQLSIDFYVDDEGPEELPAFTIDLTNAVIKGAQPIRQLGPRQSRLKSSELTRIQFSFQKIQFTWKSGGVTTKDDWTQ